MTESAYHAEGIKKAKQSRLKPSLSIVDDRFGAINPDFAITRDGYHVRIIHDEMDEVHGKISKLIQRMYSWRGLATDQPAKLPKHAGQTTLAACKGDLLFGTLTVGIDTPRGLLADTLYQGEIDEARSNGARVCEVTRLAMDPSHSSPEVLASVFHLAFMITRLVHRMTDLFVEVHPRHTAFYSRMMGYEVAGPERICPRVGAPAVLMRLSLEHAEREIRRIGGNESARDRSLYRLFFSPPEQDKMLRDLQGLRFAV
ncbi:N-acyl amino acid synthase FeeM domain-containing protein [Aromatoleum buckelii]|uniref:Long-chain N-acyl amino acid synthase n=1 Tax=Aromatoleum buckelii TaxID=200254 RepID=A0ABX1N2S8_9RHOO|nr:long-chain N-acyl amino acid synthase [Aromatoleum buckelii]MCK0510724.1 long-chain N-acyl amino acid synthase [Aromatoleum buckelii]